MTPLPNRPNRRARERQSTAIPRAIATDAPKHGGSSRRGRMSQSWGGGRRVDWSEGPGDLGPQGSASPVGAWQPRTYFLAVEHQPPNEWPIA